MPTYEYECLKCGSNFEIFQNIADPPLDKCSRCKGKLRRLIGSGYGLIFKGSGFYSTDYKKQTSPSETKKEQNPSCSSCPQPTCDQVNKNKESK